MPEILIYDLADVPECLPLISAWLQKEWHATYGEQTCSEIEQRLAGWLARDIMPAAMIAVADGDVVGVVVLRDRLPGQCATSPVIESMYVLPDFRRRGVASKLLRAAENRARDIGLSRLYLFTRTLHAYYGAHGWHRYAETSVYATTVTVLEKWLEPQRMFQPHPPSHRG